MDCSRPGFSVHGILLARILEWIAISFFRGSSDPRIKPGSSALQADSLPSELQRKPNKTPATCQSLVIIFNSCEVMNNTSFFQIRRQVKRLRLCLKSQTAYIYRSNICHIPYATNIQQIWVKSVQLSFYYFFEHFYYNKVYMT